MEKPAGIILEGSFKKDSFVLGFDFTHFATESSKVINTVAFAL